MRDFFKHITQLNLPVAIVLLAVGVGLWIPDIISCTGQSEINYPLLLLPQTMTVSMHPLTLLLLTLAMTIVNAVILSSLLYYCGSLQDRSLLPIILYLICIGSVEPFRYQLNSQIGIAFFGMVLMLLYSVYRQPAASEQIFIATILTLLAAIFLPDMLWFVLFIWISLIICRAISLRMWLASLIGIALVATYTIIALYVFGDGLSLTTFSTVFTRSLPHLTTPTSMILKILVLLIAIALITYYYTTRSRLNVKHIVAGDLFTLTAAFVFLLALFPSADHSIMPLGAFTLTALAVHYFNGSPSVVRGSLFIVYLFIQIIYSLA